MQDIDTFFKTFFKGIGIHLFALFLIVVVLPLLFQTVLIGIVQPQSGGVTPEEWAKIFREGGLIGSGVSFFLYVFWYASGLIPNWIIGARAFFLWWSLFAILLISAIAPAFFFKVEISNVWLVWLVYGLNSLLAYCFSTALFSPPYLLRSVPLYEWLKDIFNK